MSQLSANQLNFASLRVNLTGELYFDESSEHRAVRMAYATDASVYQELPIAVALPREEADLLKLVEFCRDAELPMIPRTAGTSLAGQVVGTGLVIDLSRYMNGLLEVNQAEKWVRVQPGIERDVLNELLLPYGLFFGPETSTSNRAMIGGMIGNNSCGLHSMVWGATRDHVLELKVILADGETALMGALDEKGLEEKRSLPGMEGEIYRAMHGLLGDVANQSAIHEGYPAANVIRRNSGYALDSLLDAKQYGGANEFNLCRLIAGSEGTLALITEAKLNLLDLPPKEKGLVCVHCSSLKESLLVNLVAIKHGCYASELVDDVILSFTKNHREQQKNRFFIEGDPAALLMIEFMEQEVGEMQIKAAAFINELKLLNLGYAWPLLTGSSINKAWDLRKAGLGLLRNIQGDSQPVNLIEDCAVAPDDLPDYIEELQALLASMNLKASYYAHAGAGELHVEPLINLKSDAGRVQFRELLARTAAIVKKYKGSLSGEHGDGRLRGEFIPFMMGDRCYELCKETKLIFDPKQLFNPGKITDAPPMDDFFRMPAKPAKEKVSTHFNFDREGGILALAEKCSGSGDCRKTHRAGGTMCPSYMATRFEKDTTRARANILRQFLSADTSVTAFDHEEIHAAMDLCLSCKGCKAECPSSVDVSKLKAEFLQQYYDLHGVPLKARMIGEFPALTALASKFPGLYNWSMKQSVFSKPLKRLLNMAAQRDLPELHAFTLREWGKKREERENGDKKEEKGKRRVYFFCDEFTNYNDVVAGMKCIELLERLGYEVLLPKHIESGRTHLSKGLVKRAKEIAAKNLALMEPILDDGFPIIGLEPSAILSFRDEYLDLVPRSLLDQAKKLAAKSFLVEEFLAMEVAGGRIGPAQFHSDKKEILVHGHCHQKALSSVSYVMEILSIPANYVATLVNSGCCGMAGSFGYDKDHYEVSMQIGELVLFPAVRQQSASTLIAASGTSCRHQIKDGTGRVAQHPVEILYEALI
ncbi:FAD-binding and (Fe-S)-binding domain-containing protein [Flavihumibacter sp. UBA7668]|uniref:FAD-binding and (Fe-S)-binding domain-containing protein n=1 Tax=Flavihumibacter sp. UBA7668 TaxID=1946542 RepID=UPI0025BAF8D0|nr:FAD-binding and (Fe-S)-binding domain-containing protein [Flavihumibacter sp. UBA7668]